MTRPVGTGAEHLDPWLAEKLAEVDAIMRERGAKYGPGNIAEFGELGVLVRLSDKLARLRHSRGTDFADESSRDAWLDIIGYGLIGLAWADGNWPGSEKPLELSLREAAAEAEKVASETMRAAADPDICPDYGNNHSSLGMNSCRTCGYIPW